MKLEGLKINFFGDSITYGTATSGPDFIFHGILKREAKLREIKNYGFGGSRFATQTGRFPTRPFNNDPASCDMNSFPDRLHSMDDDADIVVVFGGTNDYGHGDALLGCMSDRTPETFYGGCHYVFSELVKKYLGKPIVIMTPLHRSNETKNTGDAKPVGIGTLKEYVDIIREVAEFYSLPVLDLFAISGLQPEIPEIKEKYMPDGLHPNDRGHEIIARLLKNFLEAL